MMSFPRPSTTISQSTFSLVYFDAFSLMAVVLFYSYDFIDFELSDLDTCKAVLRMFIHCDLINTFHIPYKVSTFALIDNIHV